MTAQRVRLWSRIHTWTSLICTAFLLMLCVTGLPLIFHHEIGHLTAVTAEPAALPAATPHADLDRLVSEGLKRHPGGVVQYIVWDRDEPDLVHLFIGRTYDAPIEDNKQVSLDARTAQVLGQPDHQQGFMYVMVKLHVDMFAGLPGKLFLGAMGLMFVVAIVSGVVLYAPFMRRLDFGTIRRDRAARATWLDLHNLLGVATLVWALVVGTTGVINTWADLMLELWQADQLADTVAPYQAKPALHTLGPVQAAVDVVRAAAPGMAPAFVAYPGTPFTGRHHYGVFMRGDTPITARLLTPALVDAQSGALTDMRDLPWYMTALLASQPLHFGDYGGLPLKLVWALLDLITIAVLGSGLYLWAARRQRARADVARRSGDAAAGSIQAAE